MRLFLHKLTHWEYWPTWIVYIPVYFVYIYFALRARAVFYFTAVNPGLRNGGAFNVSKKEIYNLIPAQYYPNTMLISPSDLLTEIEGLNKFTFPLVVKPDKGLRGKMVEKIHSFDALKTYHKNASFDYLIQEFVEYENEVGIFYIRKPNEANGSISGIVGKEFLKIKGDGLTNVYGFLKKDPRYEFQIPAILKDSKINLEEVLQEGETRILVPYGNHNRGTKFLDLSDQTNIQLTAQIDKICKQVNGFYYGRIDLRFKSWEAMEKGEDFSIIEINGAMSEPTHIYDPKHRYLFGLKEIINHYRKMFTIAHTNRKQGINCLSFTEGVREMKAHFATVALMAQMSKSELA